MLIAFYFLLHNKITDIYIYPAFNFFPEKQGRGRPKKQLPLHHDDSMLSFILEPKLIELPSLFVYFHQSTVQAPLAVPPGKNHYTDHQYTLHYTPVSFHWSYEIQFYHSISCAC